MKNCFDRTPHTMKDWLLLAAGVGSVFLGTNFPRVYTNKYTKLLLY